MTKSSKLIVVRLRDQGCWQNAKPVADQLKEMGYDVRIFLDKGDTVARGLYDGSLPSINHIPPGVTVMTCLPLGEGFETLVSQQNPVILIQENPDASDVRFPKWLAEVNLKAICTLSKESTENYPLTRVTGLPTIDTATATVGAIDVNNLFKRLSLTGKTVASIALPGNEVGCRRILRLVESSPNWGAIWFPRSHPKLKKFDPEGFERVRALAMEICGYDLNKTNDEVNPHESIALALHGGFFVTTHDSTMAWQAAGAGVRNILILPPDEQAVVTGEWAKSAPIITSGFGMVFDGTLTTNSNTKSLVTGHAMANIAEVVVEVSK